MRSDEYEIEKRFWIDRFARTGEVLSDEELKRMAAIVDHSDFRDIFTHRIRLHYSLRTSRDAGKLAQAVREFDKSSTALGNQMKGIARAQLWLALAALIVAAVTVIYAPWGELVRAWGAF
jgi:hypothetical protein